MAWIATAASAADPPAARISRPASTAYGFAAATPAADRCAALCGSRAAARCRRCGRRRRTASERRQAASSGMQPDRARLPHPAIDRDRGLAPTARREPRLRPPRRAARRRLRRRRRATPGPASQRLAAVRPRAGAAASTCNCQSPAAAASEARDGNVALQVKSPAVVAVAILEADADAHAGAARRGSELRIQRIVQHAACDERARRRFRKVPRAIASGACRRTGRRRPTRRARPRPAIARDRSQIDGRRAARRGRRDCGARTRHERGQPLRHRFLEHAVVGRREPVRP